MNSASLAVAEAECIMTDAWAQPAPALGLPPKPLLFYHYRQNNSGGYHSVQPGPGIAAGGIIVQARSCAEADAIAEQIGVYFDGVEEGGDCECCGDRWSRAWDGDPEPMHYHLTLTLVPLASMSKEDWYKWDAYIIHYHDGTRKGGLTPHED